MKKEIQKTPPTKQKRRTQPPIALTPGRLLRIDQFIPDIIPISKSGWWDGVRKGVYPQPIKLSDRVTVWRSDSLIALINDREGASHE